MVHGCGLRLLTEQGWHEAHDTFREQKEPYIITIENMKGVIGIQVVEEKAYIVGSETVLSYLIHSLRNSDCTLLRTPDRPRSVAQVLVTYILAGGSKIYHNGDIDSDGICIADRLWRKFGDRIYIWGISSENYDKNLSKGRIEDIGRAKLENIGHPTSEKTAECMKEKQPAGYQENMLKGLLEDMQN